MIHRFYREWRKVFILSATFLFAIFLAFSCKKKETGLGINSYDPSELLKAGAIDTFTLKAYTIIDDSVITKNPALNVLGEMNDPVFGKVNASFYTQIRIPTVDPDLGDINTIIIDSFVLAMRYADFTGTSTTQTFEVYELKDDISSDTSVSYYEYSSIDEKPGTGNLVMPGKGTLKPNPLSDVMIDTVLVAPQLRLHLDTNLARTFLQKAAVSGGSFSSNENFVNDFKGIKVMVNNPPLSVGQGGVFSFDMRGSASKLTIYYRQLEQVSGVWTQVKNAYDFVINSDCQMFNHAEFDRSGTKVQQAADFPGYGAESFYAQSFGTRAVLEIPSLKDLPKGAVIHKAILDLPFEFQSGSQYNPGITVNLSSNSDFNSILTSSINNFIVSDITKSVNMNIRSYVQNIVIGNDIKPLYITPTDRVIAMHRIIFNGPNTTNKVKPKLYIIYTEF